MPRMIIMGHEDILSLCPSQALIGPSSCLWGQAEDRLRSRWPRKEWDQPQSVLGRGASETHLPVSSSFFLPRHLDLLSYSLPTKPGHGTPSSRLLIGSEPVGRRKSLAPEASHGCGSLSVTVKKESLRCFTVPQGAFIKAQGQDPGAGRGTLGL